MAPVKMHGKRPTPPRKGIPYAVDVAARREDKKLLSKRCKNTSNKLAAPKDASQDYVKSNNSLDVDVRNIYLATSVRSKRCRYGEANN